MMNDHIVSFIHLHLCLIQYTVCIFIDVLLLIIVRLSLYLFDKFKLVLNEKKSKIRRLMETLIYFKASLMKFKME